MKKNKEESELILIATVGKSKGLKGEFFLNSLCDPK
jgi:ribosomal 30S subunit maturation factor RimM